MIVLSSATRAVLSMTAISTGPRSERKPTPFALVAAVVVIGGVLLEAVTIGVNYFAALSIPSGVAAPQ
ncbi:hypothetical protein GCM10027258_44470 [Amycolatopsis stemonae]